MYYYLFWSKIIIYYHIWVVQWFYHPIAMISLGNMFFSVDSVYKLVYKYLTNDLQFVFPVVGVSLRFLGISFNKFTPNVLTGCKHPSVTMV